MSAPNQMTPTQALGVVAQELSASASTPLLDNDGTAFTLRGAIGRILWKVNFLLPLAGRPTSPTAKDDLYGHLLNLRAEHLITQNILAQLASKLGIDVAKARQDVINNLNSTGASS